MTEANRQLVWAPKAKQDLHSIWQYFARVASPEIADKLLLEIARGSERLRERPFLGRARAEIVPGLRSILVQPYSVFYRVTADAVEIVRVLHERRDFPTAFKKDER